MKKVITYFVCGGHGTTVCKEAWTQPESKNLEIESNLCIGVVDDGGHSGLMRQIFEVMKADYVPLGDLRNIWADSISNHVMSELIQKRISTTLDFDQLKVTLTKEVTALKSLVSIYCKNGSKIEEYLPSESISQFIDQYVNALEKLIKTSKTKLYDKHNIGNLFLAAIAFSLTSSFGKSGYKHLSKAIKEICLFEQDVNIHLIDQKRLELIVQNSRGDVIVKGEGIIDLVEFPVNLQSYEVFDPKTQKIPSKQKQIIDLINSSDLIVIPPGSETNSYPWLKYYAKELSQKKVVRVINLTVEQSSEGFIEEIAFLENLGLRPFYLYPKTFSDIRHSIGDEQYFKLIAKYSQQNKRPNDLSKDTILKGLHLRHPEVLDKVSIKDLQERILDIIEVQAFTSNGESHQELAAYIEDDPYISKKGFRHSTKQIREILHMLIE